MINYNLYIQNNKVNLTEDNFNIIKHYPNIAIILLAFLIPIQFFFNNIFIYLLELTIVYIYFAICYAIENMHKECNFTMEMKTFKTIFKHELKPYIISYIAILIIAFLLGIITR